MPKGKKSKRRPLATRRKPEAEIAAAQGILMYVPRISIIARQLDTAIHLWFMEDDPVSTHVLACGAHRNLAEIAGNSEKGPNQVDEKHYNIYHAFRHGTCDVDFARPTTESMLLDAVLAFHRMYEFRTAYMSTFGSFLVLHSTLRQEPDTEAFFEGLLIKDVRHLSRQEFFIRVVPVFATREPVFRTRVTRQLFGR